MGTKIAFQAQCVEPHWLVLLYAKTRQTSLIFCGAFSLFAQNREGARRSQSTSSAALVHVHKNCRKNVAQIDGKQRGIAALGWCQAAARVSDLKFFLQNIYQQGGR